jgi:Tripartite tricarboxylate transporter family receptor
MASHIERRKLLATLGSAVAWPLVARAQQPGDPMRRIGAQGYPSHPVRVVVPYAAGGSTDTVARITADRLSRIWGRQVVIENKPGGGTNIAAAAVAGSDPDGYTMFIGSPSLATSRLLYRSLPYALGEEAEEIPDILKAIAVIKKCKAFYQCLEDRDRGKVKHCYENDRRWR